MSYTVPWGNLPPPNDDGSNNTGGMLGRLAGGARDLACSVYRNVPPWLILSPSYWMLRAFWADKCEPPHPPPPVPPFEGGQCCDVMYLVSIQYRFQGTQTSGWIQQPPATHNWPGKIGKLEARWLPDWRITSFGVWTTSCSGSLVWRESGSTSQPVTKFEVQQFSVSRLDGGLDNCGSLPPEWPPFDPMPPGDLSLTINIGGENNTTNFDLDLTFEAGDLALSLEPHIRLGDINITFDLGGVTFSPPGSPPPTHIPPPNWELPPLNWPPGNFTEPPNRPPDWTLENNNNITGTIINELNDNSVEITENIDNSFSNLENNLTIPLVYIQNQLQTQIDINNEINLKISDILDKLNEPESEETETFAVVSGHCEDGVWLEETVSLTALKKDKQHLQELFALLARTGQISCEKEECQVLGIPLPYYEASTSECAVLYFAHRVPRGKTIGRYLSIPKPNLELLVQEGDNIPNYRPGRYYSYVQFQSAKGNKISVFGQTAQEAENYRDYLRQFSLFTEDDVYNRAKPRENSTGYEFELSLVRITYFKERRGKYNGGDAGDVIYERRWASDPTG